MRPYLKCMNFFTNLTNPFFAKYVIVIPIHLFLSKKKNFMRKDLFADKWFKTLYNPCFISTAILTNIWICWLAFSEAVIIKANILNWEWRASIFSIKMKMIGKNFRNAKWMLTKWSGLTTVSPYVRNSILWNSTGFSFLESKNFSNTICS